MSALESKLRRLATSLDSAALEALANKGLLRRAQKDLERGIETRIAGETATTLHVRVGDFEVTLPESGPATAACSCPAAGMCQHILAAVIFLQQPASQGSQKQLPGVNFAEPAENPDRQWMAITPEQLERWAGKASFKAGLKLAGQFAPEILVERAIRLRFPALNSEVHFVPGGGLDGVIVSGGKGDSRQLVVAALVGFQRAQGTEWPMLAAVAALEASDDAPRSRPEVLQACQTLLDETLSNGLSRLSSANQQRWATLAVSALGVNLPRLALLLRGIGDEAALVLSRDARSNPARMLVRMAQGHALCAALQNGGENPRADLVGLHRTRYDEVGHLDLVGAAAWPWSTASGYEGLTVLFWDPSAKQWNSCDGIPAASSTGRFQTGGPLHPARPLEGAESPRQLARSGFRLMNARRNPGNRLSGSSKSRVLVTGPANLIQSGLAAIDDWSQLQQQSNAKTSAGLMETNPLDSVFAVKPAAWGEHGYDPVRQAFAWVLADAQQHSLLLEIIFDEFTEPAIRFLETVPPASIQGAIIIGRGQRTSRGLSLHPYSLHQQNGQIVHLALDNVNSTAAKTVPNAENAEEGFEAEEEAESASISSPAISRALDEVEDGLLALAESGLAALNPLRLERIRQIAPRMERLGLQGLAAGLGKLVAVPISSAVLRCSYLSQLHRRALPLAF